MEEPPVPADILPVDWDSWQPRERAVLCFIFHGPDVLLIRKKRGLGAGKVNGPGGRIEPGETPLEAAIRETHEEVGLRPMVPSRAGELFFQFADGHSIHCEVFTSEAWEGDLIETDEADPFWCPVAEVPFAKMWADDEHWFPWMLDKRPFRGRFVFDGDRMLFSEVS